MLSLSLRVLPAAIVCLVGALSGDAAEAADAAHGQDVFLTECADCHSMTVGRAKKGPSLAGIIGRKAGTSPEFGQFSAAMQGSGITWTPDRLTAYLRNPRGAVPGGTMKYDGLADDKAVADLIAFLAKPK
jgi:cytochrome c